VTVTTTDPHAEAQVLSVLSHLPPETVMAPPYSLPPGAVDPLANPLIAAAKILIIDDELANVRLLERILRRANCQHVFSTTDSREALSCFQKHEPDLVLTDWMMPYVDGFEVLQQLLDVRGSDDYLPIIVLTADMGADTKRRALAAGATDFLTKPFDQMEVLLRIGNLLQSRVAHLKIQEQNATLESDVRERTFDLEKALTELRSTQRQVVQQERLAALGTMAGGIAHDFNNALSVIIGFGELLLRDAEKGLSKERALPPLNTILTAAEDASRIVGRLREFYRQDGADELRLPVNFNELLEHAVDLTRPRWETQSRAAGHPISLNVELDEIGLISGDAAELREVLTNMIFNAVDAMPDGGTITLRTIATHNHVAVEISDTGTGMSDDVRERCLEPFFTTKGDKGTGLGLSMVFGIVQRHGGSVDLNSSPGKGTTFRLRFPISGAAGATAIPTADAAINRPLHILVVDDQPVLCELLREYLIHDLHSVATADNPLEALKIFREDKFDLVITDRVMAEMNGEQLATEIKLLAPRVPVILLTGFGDDAFSREATRRSIDLVVCKPLLRSTLRNAIGEVMNLAAKRPHQKISDGV
jgi:signal transduction histidine kinase